MNAPPVSGDWSSSFDIPVREAPGSVEPIIAQTPKPPAKLSIVLPFIEREVPQVLKLLDWMTQLSGQVDRTIYLLPFKGLDIEEIKKKAAKAFTDVQIIQDSEGVLSDWQLDEKIRDAAGPNSLFRQAAWFFYVKPNLGPWLWLEPDCVPLTEDWIDRIEIAYRSSGKPFMGVKMKWKHNQDEYLNGAAIYPQNAIAIAPQLVTRTMWTEYPQMEIGFDVAGGKFVERQAAVTDLIQLDYRSADPRPRKGVVLFHGDRRGQLLEALSGGARAERTVRSKRPAAFTGKTILPAQNTSKRKRDDAKCAATADQRSTASIKTGVRLSKTPTRQSNGAAKVQPSVAPTLSPEQIRERNKAYREKWNANNPERLRQHARKAHLKKKFGLTVEQYEEIFLAQDGRCAICKRPSKTKTSLHVDHCHADGRVRGLLCNNCNIALGLLREDEGTIAALSDYLRWTKPTIGDQIRFYVRELTKLATNANRKARIVAELRRVGLVPKRRY